MKLYDSIKYIHVNGVKEEFMEEMLHPHPSIEHAQRYLRLEVAGTMIFNLIEAGIPSYDGMKGRYFRHDYFTDEELRALAETHWREFGWFCEIGHVVELDIVINTPFEDEEEKEYKIALFDRDTDEWLEYNNQEEEIEYLKKCISENLKDQDQLEEELEATRKDMESARGVIMKYHQTLGEIDDLATQIAFHTRELGDDDDE